MNNKSFFSFFKTTTMRTILFRAFCFTLLLSTLAACKKDEPAPEPEPSGDGYALGWTGNDDMDHVQSNIGYGNFGNGDLPASIDLTSKFPPIGDQGAYGTCVAWSVAYNYKTAIQGMDKGYGAAQLASAAYQFSPKDLFTSIPDSEKGNDCNGTNFVSALSVLQDRGVATLQTVPYTGLGDCSQNGADPAWAQEAGAHKIEYWRKLQAQSADDIKRVLAQNIPVIFGARLADNFMTWNSEAVITSHTSFNNVGQHAYHAMVIAGYDDGKGPNGAFKVINSWGDNWGAGGCIWIDYNFFLNEFCTLGGGDQPLFMAANKAGDITPPTDPDPVSTGVDLAAWVFDDFAKDNPNGIEPLRESDFNIYSIGNQTAGATQNWSAYYIAFNAYDANDYHVLYNVDFNASVAPGTIDCPTFNSCVANVDLAPGQDLGSALFNSQAVAFEYTVPNITGDYYLVLFVDVADTFGESDEINNLFYPSFEPIYFQGGFGLSPNPDDRSGTAGPFGFKNTLEPARENFKKNPHHTIVTPRHPNAYRMEEIRAMLKVAKKDGRLAGKVAEMRKRNK
jgi:hypothetical protein